MLHESGEDYLEAILVIRRQRGSCRNVDIAERLGRSKPSVSKALSNLVAAGLVRMCGLVDRRGLKVAQARSAPARTGLSIPGSKMIRLGDHAAGKPPRVSVPRTPP